MAFQTINDGVYKKLIGPKKKAWPKFPLHLGSLVIPTSTWDAVLGEQIQSLKLGFSTKRKHDPKGCFDAHFKQYHIKINYVHEEIPDDSICQGVSTFFEVLGRAKSKDEEAHILQHQKELKERIQCYRALQIGLLEKVRKDREEKEAEAMKNSSVATFPDGDKGKGLMEDLPKVPVSQ